MRTSAIVLTTALGAVLHTPGADAQVNLTSCQTITERGSYLLTQNVSASEDCFVIEADLVTPDLNGHVISGEMIPGGNGIEIEERVHIVVRNGIISNFDVGIFATGAAITIEGVRAIGNDSAGIFGAPGPLITVRNSTAADNNVQGMLFGQGTRVEGNTVANNGQNGLFVGGGSIVTGNIARDNGSLGVAVGGTDEDDGSTVSGNVATGNSIGIQVVCPSNVFGNMATGNDRDFNLIGPGCIGADVPPP